MTKSAILPLGCLMIFLLTSATCMFVSTDVYKFEINGQSSTIQSPTKAHLVNGSMIVFAHGFEMSETSLEGIGLRYNLTRNLAIPVESIHRDSVVFIEYYAKETQSGPLIASLGAPLLFLAAIQNEEIHKAIFGSCPTVYSHDNEKFMLEAECFSYSISPKIEAYDLDRLNHAKIKNGDLVLNVRNEALETHYINQMNLLVVEHPKEYESFPLNKAFLEDKDQTLLFGQESPLSQATCKTGLDVKNLLIARDSLCYQSDPQLLKFPNDKVEKDWLDIYTEIPDNAEKMVVALRFRNTLFYTVEFYDVLLAGYGVHAVDWMGLQMQNLPYLLKLYNWYQKYYGIQVELWSDSKLVETEFIDDSGPLAWRHVAFELPVPKENSAKLRFNFLPDNVMIDWIGISYDTNHEFIQTPVECKEIRDVRRDDHELSSSLVHNTDSDYFITQPAESYQLTFHVGEEPEHLKRTYFIHSRGYYIEWIRRDWINQSGDGENNIVFQMDESSILQAAQKWAAKKDEFEKQFFNSKIQIKEGS